MAGRCIKVRATCTGKLLATVSPPRPYHDFTVLTAAANGRVLVFGARRFWNATQVRRPGWPGATSGRR